MGRFSQKKGCYLEWVYEVEKEDVSKKVYYDPPQVALNIHAHQPLRGWEEKVLIKLIKNDDGLFEDLHLMEKTYKEIWWTTRGLNG